MSKKTNPAETAPPPAGGKAAAALPVNVLAQYIRDVSFENPNAPDSFRAGRAAPEMDINIGMDARKIPDTELKNLYEVVLNVRAEARRKAGVGDGKDGADEVLFIAEILYGITVSVGETVPENNHHPLLLIEIPRLAFPYVRQILSDLTTQGGYPPLLLNPVDFHALYMQRFGKELSENAAQQSDGSSPSS
ncbi:MAG: protein-export chaperone SecB [Alphaproteobacteria bacterium]